MITIQAAMLIMLGILLACLAALLILPYYGRRAARLAREEMRRSMPLTAEEIRADKDRLRAEHAIATHKLEMKLEEAELSAAHQRIELNMRDAAISALESAVADLKTEIEENENARRVLEQTITDRLPRVEQRFTDAKRLLLQRDSEIAALTESAARQARALEEAAQINAQQRDEMHRLSATLAARAARNREILAPDARLDEEVALRAELEALRMKARDQAALIARLQQMQAQSGGRSLDVASAVGNGADDAEAARLKNDLAEAEIALKAARPSNHAAVVNAALEAELRILKSERQDKDTEIARIKAALQAYEAEDADSAAIKESKLALKARLSALQAQSEQQQATILSQRAEIAAANEKLARQAAHFMDEMRRLGAGTLPASGAPRRDVAAVEGRRRSLAERIAQPRTQPTGPTGAKNGGEAGRKEHDPERVSGFLRALEQQTSAETVRSDAANAMAAAPSGSAAAAPFAAEPEIHTAAAELSVGHASPAGPAPGVAAEPASAGPASEAVASPPAPAAAEDEASTPAKRRRPGLLERLTGVDKAAAGS